MHTLKFNVQGSSPEPYEVVFYFLDDKLSGSCTCAAGKQSKYCRLKILQGEINAVASDCVSDFATLNQWYVGSYIQDKIKGIKDLKEGIESLKSSLKMAENELSKLLSR